ncbi:ligninase LG6 precursor [Pyrenochaeta sp. MPI-SDFR-AT-0127]|nr:ligninase LG6 precursor [Pyrenochaeta sp. MPI-SDFR-AT-0127]
MSSYTIILLALPLSSFALDLWPRQSSRCPPVWTEVAKELETDFAGCGADAHLAIRAPFHDCINNGCDASLILSEECTRSENAGLSLICGKLGDWATKFNVSAADMIQFAAAMAISACPLGPKVRALVGRNDSSNAAPEGLVPNSKDSVDKILAAFGAKGFSPDDVVALMGTHSVALQFNDDPSQAGKSLDSTPSVYDMNFYKETKEGTAPYSLQSDKLLANNTQTADTWSEFANDATAWNKIFTNAWNRFSVIGNDVETLQDCSSLIPSSSVSKRRRAFNARFRAKISTRFRL